MAPHRLSRLFEIDALLYSAIADLHWSDGHSVSMHVITRKLGSEAMTERSSGPRQMYVEKGCFCWSSSHQSPLPLQMQSVSLKYTSSDRLHSIDDMPHMQITLQPILHRFFDVVSDHRCCYNRQNIFFLHSPIILSVYSILSMTGFVHYYSFQLLLELTVLWKLMTL